MTTAVATDEQMTSFKPLFVIPSNHPEQTKLPEAERDEAIVRAAGAVAVEGERFWRIAPGKETGAEAKAAIRRFGTRAAKERWDTAVAEMERDTRPMADRDAVARAANAEVRRAGQQPRREAPPHLIPEEDRVYLFTSREDGPFCYKRLDDLTQELGVKPKVYVVRQRGHERWGLRYVHKSMELPAELKPFTSDEALKAHLVSKEIKKLSNEAVANAAAQEASQQRGNDLPLTAPHYQDDPAKFNAARTSMRRMGTARLSKLCKITREKIDSITMEGDRRALDNKDLSDAQKKYRTDMENGLALGSHILKERESRQEANKAAMVSRQHFGEDREADEPEGAQPASSNGAAEAFRKDPQSQGARGRGQGMER